MIDNDERKWRELCTRAMIENDPNELLTIFLQLNLIMEEEERAEASIGSRGGNLS